MQSNSMLPDDIVIHNLRTQETDAAEILNKNQVSKAKIVSDALDTPKPSYRPLAERLPKPDEIVQRQKIVYEETRPTPKHSSVIKNIIFTAIAGAVIFASGYGILQIAKERSKEIPVVAPVSTTESESKSQFITFTSEKNIDFSAVDLSNREILVSKLREEAVPGTDGIIHFKMNVSGKELLRTLSSTFQSGYSRALSDDIFYGATPSGNFLLLKIDSYGQAFASQLEWDRVMGTDLLPLFSISAKAQVVVFEDQIVSNHDVRTALDETGFKLFLYGYYDKKIIIFAQNEEVFNTVYDLLKRQSM